MLPFSLLANLIFNDNFFSLSLIVSEAPGRRAMMVGLTQGSCGSVEAQVVNANFEKLNPTGLRVIRDGPSIVISPNTNFKLHLFQESSGMKLKF